MNWRRIGPACSTPRMPRRCTHRVRHLVVLPILLVACAPKPPPRPNTQLPQTAQGDTIVPSPAKEQLASALKARIGRDSGQVALALIDLETGIRLGINADSSMHAASMIKVPVMLEIFRQAERQGTQLTDSVAVLNEFTSVADRSKYTLKSADDSDSTLYRRVGTRTTVRELVRLMITRSSNLAANILIERAGPANVARTLTEAGITGVNVVRGVEDGPAYQRGLNNTITADGFARVLEAIVRCNLTSRESCEEMIDILAAQEFNDMIPAGLPAGTRVAHKTGWITQIRHDGGIVFPRGRSPYILVIQTNRFADPMVASRLAADLSRIVWIELNEDNFALPTLTPTARNELELHRRFRNPAIGERRFTPAELVRALEPYTGRMIRRETIGRSAAGLPLYAYRFGNGSVRVLIWSQMHGNESIATMALTDLARYLHESNASRVQEWASRLSIAFVPMLNPDGAERAQRNNNNTGLDGNRDASTLQTPEDRELKAYYNRFQPHFAFSLRDQSPRTLVGGTNRQAAIALLAPPRSPGRNDDEQLLNSKRIAATLRRAMAPFVGGFITRYDDTDARAADLVQGWGARTVLIESGGWAGDLEGQYLRSVNFVALLNVLDAIADDSYRQTPIELYNSLPQTGRSVNDP
jgi:beta-lactamase class A